MKDEMNKSLAEHEDGEAAMPINDDKLYEEIGRTWRHFGSWREKAFAGYLTVLAALAVGFSHNTGLLVRAGIFAGAILVSAVFWILDLRNLQLMNACQLAAGPLECEKGCYAELNRVRFYRRTSPTHGLAVNLLVDGVGTAGVGGLCTCFIRWWSGGLILWPSWQPLIGGMAALVIWVHIRLKKLAERERAEDEAQYRAQKIDKDCALPPIC
jgi:hypothetical protein